MKILLGLLAFFMLPSAVIAADGSQNAEKALNGAQNNVVYSPEAHHDSNYYSIDLVVDDSLSYSPNNVHFICRTTGFSNGVDFYVDGNDYYVNQCPVLDDGSSFEIHLAAKWAFEECTTVFYARQYDDQSHSYITRSETIYSVWRDDHVSLSTSSMEHAHDCADLAYFKRISSNQSLARDFFTE